MYALRQNKSLVYCLDFYLLNGLFLFAAAVRTTFISEKESYFLNFLLFAAFFVLISAISKFNNITALFAATFAGMLLLSSSTVLPMLYYTSSFAISEVYNVCLDAFKAAILTIITAAVFALVIAAVTKLKTNKKYSEWLNIIVPLLTLLCCVPILLADTSSNTTTLFGVQISLIIGSFLILSMGWAFSTDNKASFWLTLIGIAAVLFCMIIKKETGIPIIFFLSFCAFYVFGNFKKNKLITVSIIAVPVLAVLVLLLSPIINKYFNFEFLKNIVNLITTRIFNGEPEQIKASLLSISQGGLRGSPLYVYLSEGSSDFIFTQMLHFLGAKFLIPFISSLLPLAYFGYSKFSAKQAFPSETGWFALCLLLTVCIFNLSMCLGTVPVVGVQMAFSGFSKSISIFSGGILGCLVYSDEFFKPLFAIKKKGEYYDLSED